MVYSKPPTESYHDRVRRRCQIIYVKKMREQRVFMEELAEFRKDRVKHFLKTIKNSIGPTWYQVLSVNQRFALDSLPDAIHKDLLEERPRHARRIVNRIGFYPPPLSTDLMAAVYAGEKDPKKFFSYLFDLKFGHFIGMKRPKYSLNGKLLLSCIFYLGLEDIINLLEDLYQPEEIELPPKYEPKRKSGPRPVSPYLEKMSVKPYYPQVKRNSHKPAPLPPPERFQYTAKPTELLPKPVPPPPPPPPPPNRLPRAYCDKVAGVMILQPFTSVPVTPFKPYTNQMPKQRTRKLKRHNSLLEKKTFGLNLNVNLAKEKYKKPKAPYSPTIQYMITGVYIHEERPYYTIGGLVTRPTQGFIIHGGNTWVGGETSEYVRIYSGICCRSDFEPVDPCNCLDVWGERVMDYVYENKCYCGHYYDYHNDDGAFSPDEVPYFEKPTPTKPYQFDYAQIYELDPRALYIGKEFRKIWDTESILQSEDDVQNKNKGKKKKKVVRTDAEEKNCLGEHPTISRHLKCSVPYLKDKNLAACLPDIHLTQELSEWMRRRIHGNLTRQQKKDMLQQSSDRWCILKSMESHGMGHVTPPDDPVICKGRSTWAHKKALKTRYQGYFNKYRRNLFTMQVKVNNLLWATMFQNQFPDKKFREIYFSYLLERTTDLQLYHPYNTRESRDRAVEISTKRVVCVLRKPDSAI